MSSVGYQAAREVLLFTVLQCTLMTWMEKLTEKEILASEIELKLDQNQVHARNEIRYQTQINHLGNISTDWPQYFLAGNYALKNLKKTKCTSIESKLSGLS